MSARRVTESCWPPALAATSGLSAAAQATANATARPASKRYDFIRSNSATGVEEGGLWCKGAQRAHEPVEHFRTAKPGELESERLRAADVYLELHAVECGRQPLE